MTQLACLIWVLLQEAITVQARNDSLPEAVSILTVQEAEPAKLINVQKIARAFSDYTEEKKRLPPAAIYDKDGGPLLSWRVTLLPYLGEQGLYKEFRLDEAWDSPHNKQLLAKMPAVYRSMEPAVVSRTATPYQVFVGKGTAFDGRRGLRIPEDFPDGSGNTLLFVEAADPVPWTKPAELPFSPDKPVPKLGAKSRPAIAAGFADGSVHDLRKDLPHKVLRALISRNGGETVRREDYEWRSDRP